MRPPVGHYKLPNMGEKTQGVFAKRTHRFAPCGIGTPAHSPKGHSCPNTKHNISSGYKILAEDSPPGFKQHGSAAKGSRPPLCRMLEVPKLGITSCKGASGTPLQQTHIVSDHVLSLRKPSYRFRKMGTTRPSRVWASMFMGVTANHEVLVDHGVIDAVAAALLQSLVLEVPDGIGVAHAQGQVAGGIFVKQGVVEEIAALGNGELWGTRAHSCPGKPRPRPWKSWS